MMLKLFEKRHDPIDFCDRCASICDSSYRRTAGLGTNRDRAPMGAVGLR
jgi:hypothetical protein